MHVLSFRSSMLRITKTRGRMDPSRLDFSGQRLRLGTAIGNDLRFAEDSVLPAHAEICREGSGYVLLDLGTASGTYVGGTRIRRQELRHRNHVSLGGPTGPGFRVEMQQSTASPAPSAPSADAAVDLATAARIVAAAVARETNESDKTRSVVATRVEGARRGAARANVLLTIGVLLTFGALLVTASYLWQSQRVALELAAQVGIDRTPAPPVHGTVPTRITSGREIYDQNRAAVYVVGFVIGAKVGGVCTGFAIRPNVLATNAHCVNAFRTKGGTPTVTQNDSSGRVRHRILAAQVHPAYKPGRAAADSPDVGLIRIEGTMSKTVTLASDAEIHALGPGDDIFVLGFPGRVMDPLNPIPDVPSGSHRATGRSRGARPKRY